LGFLWNFGFGLDLFGSIMEKDRLASVVLLYGLLSVAFAALTVGYIWACNAFGIDPVLTLMILFWAVPLLLCVSLFFWALIYKVVGGIRGQK
jgi:hypothetical protein